MASERGMPISDYMGWTLRIANPLRVIRARCVKGSSGPLCEEGFGCGAVGGGLVPVRCDPRDFGGEQRDPVSKFGLRVGGKVFACEATRRVSAGPRAIGFFHSGRTSPAKRLAVNRRDGYSRSQVG